jgi:tetratricopeptide (TPR) repeat protein
MALGTDDPIIFDRLLSLYITEAMPDKAMEIILDHEHKVKSTGAMLCKIAVLYMGKGRLESAIKCYMMALERDPFLFEAWASVGEIMLVTNKMADSRTFFEKALSIKSNDIGTIINLCDIASREAEILSVVKYCNLLLGLLQLPRNRTLCSLADLNGILHEISARLEGNTCYQNQLSTISDRISQIQNPPE